MGTRRFHHQGDYLNDMRQEPRWIDRRMVLTRLGHAEYPGVTGDVSLRGLRVALVGPSLPPESDIQIDVAYEEDLVTFQGRIRYALSRPWGCIVGVDCVENDRATSDFLENRYR